MKQLINILTKGGEFEEDYKHTGEIVVNFEEEKPGGKNYINLNKY